MDGKPNISIYLERRKESIKIFNDKCEDFLERLG